MRKGRSIDNSSGDVVWCSDGRWYCDVREDWLYFGCYKDVFDKGATMQSLLAG